MKSNQAMKFVLLALACCSTLTYVLAGQPCKHVPDCMCELQAVKHESALCNASSYVEQKRLIDAAYVWQNISDAPGITLYKSMITPHTSGSTMAMPDEAYLVRVPNAWVVENGRIVDCLGRAFELALGCCRELNDHLGRLVSMLAKPRTVPSLDTATTQLRTYKSKNPNYINDSRDVTTAVVEHAYVIAHSVSTSYYHLMYESAPKLMWALDQVIDLSMHVVVGQAIGCHNIPGQCTKYQPLQLELMALLGIPADRVLFSNSHNFVFSTNVWMPPPYQLRASQSRNEHEHHQAALLMADTAKARCAHRLVYQHINDAQTDGTPSGAGARTAHAALCQMIKQRIPTSTLTRPFKNALHEDFIIFEARAPLLKDAIHNGTRVFESGWQLLQELQARFPGERFMYFHAGYSASPDLCWTFLLHSCAKGMIGLHGAGLTNMLFLPRVQRSFVIELVHEDFVGRKVIYYPMSSRTGLRHFHVSVPVNSTTAVHFTEHMMRELQTELNLALFL